MSCLHFLSLSWGPTPTTCQRSLTLAPVVCRSAVSAFINALGAPPPSALARRLRASLGRRRFSCLLLFCLRLLLAAGSLTVTVVPLPRRGGHQQLSAVVAHNPVDDRQPEAGAAGETAVERLQDPVELVGIDADPLVGDGERDHRLACPARGAASPPRE